MPSINKKKLIIEISKEVSVKQDIVEEIIKTFLDNIIEHYLKGNRIEIREFGTFQPHFFKAKFYMDPKSKQKKKMPSKTVLKFKCSKQLHH